MSEQDVASSEKEQPEGSSSAQAQSATKEDAKAAFSKSTHRVVMAAMGAAAIAQDEAAAFIKSLREKGEIAEKDARKMMDEILDKGEKFTKEKREAWEKGRPPLATRSDIETLSDRIAELTRQVEELKRAHTASNPPSTDSQG